ncbi:hypothetical protein UlMin_030126 [Ulmus minor]
MSDEEVGKDEKKVQFVLVHGASHGGWCWYKIRSLLESDGHKVTCIDLKGAGIDLTDPNTILTFSDFNEPLVSFFSSLPQDEKVILVGHSAGGLNITDILHKFPKKIHVAVYVAAVMSRNGIPANVQRLVGFPERDALDFTYGLGPDKPPTSVIFKPEYQRPLLYNRSPIEDTTLASMLLRPSPVRPMFDAQFEETTDIDSIPRVYIKTLDDHLMAEEEHEDMIKQWPPSQVFALESDHSPFFSTPSQLFGILVEASASIK